jgi:hypothetical protein
MTELEALRTYVVHEEPLERLDVAVYIVINARQYAILVLKTEAPELVNQFADKDTNVFRPGERVVAVHLALMGTAPPLTYRVEYIRECIIDDLRPRRFNFVEITTVSIKLLEVCLPLFHPVA